VTREALNQWLDESVREQRDYMIDFTNELVAVASESCQRDRFWDAHIVFLRPLDVLRPCDRSC
jgi:hypothetical protein